ncbi:MAG: hypothetical protein Q9159_003747 [Coniocarpon cinnabarinum]
MPIYSFFIFDRHTECIYQRRWTLPLSRAGAHTNGDAGPSRSHKRSQADDAKLVFGVIFTLRNMVRQLGGEDDEFISYRTGEYKLHYYETPTSMKFVMLTDIGTSDNLRVVLHQIWANLYVEYVVRNPLSPIEHPGGLGVNNELFEMGLDRFVSQVFPS